MYIYNDELYIKSISYIARHSLASSLIIGAYEMVQIVFKHFLVSLLLMLVIFNDRSSATPLRNKRIVCGFGQRLCGTQCYGFGQQCISGIICGSGQRLCGTQCYGFGQQCYNG
jgi:hypothetical protein